jgi:hypothetical protein
MAFSFTVIEGTEVKKQTFHQFKNKFKTPRQSLTGMGHLLNWVAVSYSDGCRS